MNSTVRSILWILAGIVVLVSVFLPRAGFLARIRAARAFRRRERLEDALKYLFERRREGVRVHEDALLGFLGIGRSAFLRLRIAMEDQSLIRSEGQIIELTAAGESSALHIFRAHRLWERYLATEAGMALKRVHRNAHRLEHKTTEDELSAMEAELGYPTHDPHGDPIPDKHGVFPPAEEALPLTALPVGESGRIVHIEDEPPLAYAQIIAEGLSVGDTVRVLDAAPGRITVSNGEAEMRLAPALAGYILLSRTKAERRPDERVIPLSRLKDGQEARIVAIHEACQGFPRRRFMDLGLTPGTVLYPELKNAFGEPRAYWVRGTLIALRNEQADYILVREQHDGEAV